MFVIQMPQSMAKHRFRYCFHQATRPMVLVAMFHATNDTIGIHKVRQNETTTSPKILTSMQTLSTLLRIAMPPKYEKHKNVKARLY